MLDDSSREPRAKESMEKVATGQPVLSRSKGSKSSLTKISKAEVPHKPPAATEEERPYTIRAIRKEELDEAFEIRRQTNYVFSKSNIETSWKLQPESFLVAVSDTGELYGTVSMVDYCEGVAYLSLLAVKEELRAKKIGNDLLLAVLEKCGKKNKFMRCIFPLESVFNRLDLFMVRSKVALGRTEPVKVNVEKLAVPEMPGVTIKPFDETLLDKLCKYDQGLSGVDRSRVMKAHIDEEGSMTQVALKEDGSVAGYSVVHAMTDGSWYFYLLAAESQDLALMLIRNVALCCPSTRKVGVVLVSPLWPNEEESFVVRSLGWKIAQKSVCRFTEHEIKFDYSRIFSM